jgi:TP901 family phage tail tape measure protein
LAIDLFSLVGKISVDYSDAIKNIEKVSDAADEVADGLEDVDEAADEAGESIGGAGDSAKGADGNFSTWKATLANLASDVIQSLITRCTDLAKSVVDLGEDFTSMMSEVQAISGASDEEMAQLEKTAREFGSTTVFSATDAAEALKYMSLAGWSAEQSTSALGGVLDLAAASGMGLGEASDMVTDYLSAFGMEADKSAYFADMLAYAQSNSNTTAAQLGEAYRNCAANLNAAGQDVETTTSLLEAMANQGYKGSEAGTALAAIMRDITNAMDDGAIQIGDTTVSVMDANGNFRDLTDILTDVDAATDGMGDAERAAALSSTFTADSTKGLNLILNEGMDKISGYEDALRSADGTASDMADTMNDNLSGDLANMNSAFEELKLKIFDGLENPLRSASQFVTNTVIPALTTLVENFDKIAPVIAGVTAALVTFKVAMGISNLVSAVTTAFQAYQAANEGATVAQWLFNAALNANPIVLIVTLIAGLVAAIIVLWNTNEDFRNGVIAVWEAIKTAVTNVVNAIKTTISNVFNAVKTTVTNILNSIKTTFSNVWNSVKTTVSNVVNGVKSTISSGLNSAKSTVSSILESIKSKFSSIFEGAKTIVSNAINKIKDFFNFSWSLPKLKMPHISIDGSFSISPPSVPHFSIDWYKKAMEDGMIMNQPTIFGYNTKTNQFMAGGEAGSETVVGTSNLMQMIVAAVEEENKELTEKIEMLISILTEYLPAILSGMGRELVLDSGVLVGELAPAMDAELGRLAIRKGR